jgi:hypothetical protein
MKLGMNRGGPKESWNKALSQLVLPSSPWTVEDVLRAWVVQVRGRKLILSRDPNIASPDGPSGMWFPAEDSDLVWAHPAARGIQLSQILGHELGHMVNGDEPDKLDLKDVVRLLMGACSHTSSGLWNSALASTGISCRTDGTSSEDREREAENFGYFAERWVAKKGPREATLFEANMRESLDL